MITSKLTTKSRTTIPKPVRIALDLEPGDEVVYQIDGERVILRRVRSTPSEGPFATFSEWEGEADRDAYSELTARGPCSGSS
jgi:antitoxin PrlF